MPKKLVAFGLATLAVLLLFLPLAAGGAVNSAEPVSQPATVERTLIYAETASKLGAPWDVAMLTDAVYAMRGEQGGIEDVNPIHTSLQFAVMTITTEHYEAVGSVYNKYEDTWHDVYDWVVTGTEAYTARDAIIGELGIGEDTLDAMDADAFADAMNKTMADRSGDEYRYSATISANYDVSGVLHNYTTLTEEEIGGIVELYDVNYLIERMDEETRNQIYALMGEYGMYQHVDLETYVNCEGVVFTGGATDVVYFNQRDTRWADAPYGPDNIGGYGCGPTAMSIVVSSLTDQTADPVYMANWAAQHGYCVKGKGSAHALIPGAAAAFGLSCSGCSRTEPQRVVDALARGELVVALMSKGHFTSGGHFIVLRGVTDDGKILVADPASVTRSNQSWDLSLIVAEAHKSAAAGGPFWIIGT